MLALADRIDVHHTRLRKTIRRIERDLNRDVADAGSEGAVVTNPRITYASSLENDCAELMSQSDLLVRFLWRLYPST